MPNRIYNKQVTPKGYKRGGGVTETAKKQAMEAKPKTKATTKKFLKMVGKFTLPGAGALAGKKAMDKLRAKKMGGGMMMMERPMMKKGGPSKKPKVKKIAIGTGKAKDYPGIKKIMEMNKKGRKRFKAGGALKPVDPKTQKGLSKLPTEVRNKMGYMKKGGKVNGK
jgi:hypothetical protein